MNVVRIYGGLGNQMFQYAFGKAVQETGSSVSYDISWFKHAQIDRMFCLDRFNTNMTFSNYLGLRVVKENGFTTKFIQEKDCVFAGYWQSPKYHEKVFPILKKEFTIKEKFYTSEFLELRDKILKENSVAVHVRRGDFLSHRRHLVVPLEYFQRAMSIICSLKEGLTFYVFSDDIPWCKNNFSDVTFVHQEEYLDFELVKLCKHHIMPNSTFSLWASYLNGEGINIAPTQWDKDPVDQELRVHTKCLLPNDWIKLENV